MVALTQNAYFLNEGIESHMFSVSVEVLEASGCLCFRVRKNVGKGELRQKVPVK